MNEIEKSQEQPDTQQEYEENGSQFEPYDIEITPEHLALIKKHGIDEGDNLDDHLTEKEREDFATKYAGL